MAAATPLHTVNSTATKPPLKGRSETRAETLAAGRDLTLGTYEVDVQMNGVLGGRNTGAMSGWSGTLKIETNDDAVRDQPWLEPPIKPAPPH